MPQKSFRQRVISRIRREGINMCQWRPNSIELCDTACCLAGNIALEEGTREYPASVARKIWAKYYGVKEADRLNFYLAPEDSNDLTKTTVDDVIAHLMAIRTRK